MSDPDDGADGDSSARMQLEPDSIHEDEEEPTLDCPQCGAPVSFVQIIEEGRCTGYLEPDEAEVESEGERLQREGCTAKLSLELVWEA